MTPEEQKVQAAREEAQRLVNEADRPRIRALELEAKAQAGYYSRQPGLPLGKWRVEAGPGIPDKGKPCPGCDRPMTMRKTDALRIVFPNIHSEYSEGEYKILLKDSNGGPSHTAGQAITITLAYQRALTYIRAHFVQ